MSEATTKMDATVELWRLPKVVERTGLSKTTIWRMTKAGTFPAPRQVGASAVAWRSTEILKWIDDLPVVGAEALV
jgi:prophage regulatory protein